jgi:hypothetical protein
MSDDKGAGTPVEGSTGAHGAHWIIAGRYVAAEEAAQCKYQIHGRDSNCFATCRCGMPEKDGMVRYDRNAARSSSSSRELAFA